MSHLANHLLAAQAWQPFEPDAQYPFDRRLAAHLYRRAGFAATSAQLDEAVRIGVQPAVRQLLAAAETSEAFDADMRRFAQTMLAANSADLLAAWWLHRMRHTPAPLLETMTLFWHGHFATSAAKVNKPALMFRQNDLLRRHALGDFGELARGIARDPAMLLYLDSATNRKIHPNENFAREVMELFCLGVGNYSERDIQELARCFTGWEIQHGEFQFNPYQHDAGAKSILGQSGQFDGDQGLAVVLAQPAASEYIAGKLVRHFVTDEDVPPEWIASLARKFRETDLQIAPLVETILTSRALYDPAVIGGKVRSPIELGIGLLTALEATANLRELAGGLRELGQMPFFPPNVKGWPGGRTWIDSSTLLGRANLVRRIVESPDTRFGGGSLDAYLDRFDLKTNQATVDWLSELLMAVPATREVRQQLIATFDDRAARQAGESGAGKRLLHLLGSLPEFQLA